jgi:hypothetical protein
VVGPDDVVEVLDLPMQCLCFTLEHAPTDPNRKLARRG